MLYCNASVASILIAEQHVYRDLEVHMCMSMDLTEGLFQEFCESVCNYNVHNYEMERPFSTN